MIAKDIYERIHKHLNRIIKNLLDAELSYNEISALKLKHRRFNWIQAK